MVRRYAQDAHKRYTAELAAMRERITDRPDDLTEDRFAEFYAARKHYNLYAEPLALDADGNSAFDDEKVMDRIHDARRSALRWLLQNKLPMSGISVVTQEIAQNEARRFLSNTDFVEMEGEES
ncbi:hypothetical protein [Streptomyces sp. NPDC088752]|uniref:hypothetical protein n=1 Tax=Streptomyces sp. NPDC088752 TaxID=3154963 RepID=UPI0034122164